MFGVSQPLQGRDQNLGANRFGGTVGLVGTPDHLSQKHTIGEYREVVSVLFQGGNRDNNWRIS